MKKISLFLMLLLPICLAIAMTPVKQEIVTLYPMDADFAPVNDYGKTAISISEGNTATWYFLFPNFKKDRVKYIGYAEFIMLGDSTAAGDSDSLGIDAQPMFYDANTDSLYPSTTTALDTTDDGTIQEQLPTVANGVKEITPATYSYALAPNNTIDFVVNRAIDMGLCDAIKITVTLGAGAGTIEVYPKVKILLDQ